MGELRRREWIRAGAAASLLPLIGCLRRQAEPPESKETGMSQPASPEDGPPRQRGLHLVSAEVDDYTEVHTMAESPAMRAIAEQTRAEIDMWIMMIGPVEAALLRLFVQLLGARRVIEVGTFTGYSAIAMAEGLPEGGELITCDISEKWTGIAKQHWATSPHGSKIRLELGPALETLVRLEGAFDLAFIDADKAAYPDYWNVIVPKINSGGLIIADNVLAGGRVATGDAPTMAAFNTMVREDARVQTIMLPLRDGVTVARKL